MSADRVTARLRAEVRQRAEGRCEYCRVHEDDALFPHEADHIIADQHGGATSPENLAHACFHCNRYKGTNIASLDPETLQLTPLFHPRLDHWENHFRWDGARIVPLTPVGRATVRLLRLNEPERARLRQGLIETGRLGVV